MPKRLNSKIATTMTEAPAIGASSALRIKFRPPFRGQTNAHPISVHIPKMAKLRENAAIGD